jgi:flagellar motor switch protein FliN
MSDKTNYLDCWITVAASLFSQALAGEPALTDALPKPMAPDSFGFAATLEGEEEGRFAVLLEGSLAEATLLGEGVDQKAGWAELLREVADAAAGELLAKTGRRCQVRSFDAIAAESKLTRAFQLKAGDRSWLLQVNSEVRLAKAAKPAKAAEPAVASTAGADAARPTSSSSPGQPSGPARREEDLPASARSDPSGPSPGPSPCLSPGLELLLDVELEASLRFGAREMPLGEILDLGPGDVVQLDRHINDPVDLIVGDKIVARGEVVLVNGNFGLRVTEVAEPQKRLETIRCLF